MSTGFQKGGYQKLLDSTQYLAQRKVAVGIVSHHVHTHPTQASQSTAEIYAIHEIGRERVPARPTLRLGVSKLKPERVTRRIFKSATKGRFMDTKLNELGREMQRLVKQEIQQISSPALSPATIARRVNKGTTNPLVDTGQLKNAIGFKVS